MQHKTHKARGKADWVFQAKADRGLTFAEVAYDGASIALAATPSVRRSAKWTPAPREHAIVFAAPGDKDKDRQPPPAQRPPRPTPVSADPPREEPGEDAEMKTGDEGTLATLEDAPSADAADNETKRTAQAAGAPAKRRAKDGGARPEDFGWEAVPNPGNGDCLFHTIAQAVSDSGDKPTTALVVRAKVVGHLRKHQASYEPHWDKLTPSSMEDPFEATFADYTTALNKAGTWGGALETAAAAATYDRPMIVAHPEGPREVYNRGGRGMPSSCGSRLSTTSEPGALRTGRPRPPPSKAA